jgi:WD40 repeat protein
MTLDQIARMFARLMTALLVLVMAAAARAETPPDQRPYLRIETGMHTAAIPSVSVSADGKLLATGSRDKTARLWSLPDGKLLRTFRVPIGSVNVGRIYAVALSPDGRLLAVGGYLSGDASERIFLFDTMSGALVRRIGALPDVVHELVFGPGGRVLAAGLGNYGVRLWDIKEGLAPLLVVGGDYGSVYGIAFDAIDKMVVTSSNGYLRLYQVATEPRPLVRLLKEESTSTGEPLDVAFSADGQKIAVGFAESTSLSLLDSSSLGASPGSIVDTSFASSGDLAIVAWSATENRLFAGGSYDDGNGTSPVMTWDSGGLGKPRALGGSLNTIHDLAPLPTGDLAWAAADPAFGLFSPQGESRFTRGPVTADLRDKHSGNFWIAPDGTGVWFGLKLRDEEPWRFDPLKLSFAPAPWRPWGFVEPNTDRLKIENWMNSARPKFDARALDLSQSEIARSLAIAADGKSFVLGTDWQIRRFDASGEQSLWDKPIAVPGIVWGVNLSSDGSIIVAAQGDGTIRWYRASDGEELLAFFVHVPDKR